MSLELTEILLAVSPSFLHPHKLIFVLLYQAEYHFYKIESSCPPRRNP